MSCGVPQFAVCKLLVGYCIKLCGRFVVEFDKIWGKFPRGLSQIKYYAKEIQNKAHDQIVDKIALKFDVENRLEFLVFIFCVGISGLEFLCVQISRSH